MTRLLIVDDNPQSLYMLQALLTAGGFELELASNGAEALEKARQNPPDIIISDILMPVMDGFSLCRTWKADAQLKVIPFVFYTATYTDPQDEDFALSLGAERFILKPMEPDKLLEILREVIEAHRAGKLVAPREPVAEPVAYYEQYSATLIRKLEDKLVQLEEANRALERELAARQRAEQKTAESLERERFLGDLIRAASVAIGVGYPDGRLGMCNPAFQKLTGYSEEELKTIAWNTVLTPPEWLESEMQSLAELHRTKQPVVYEKEYIHKSGKRVPIELVVHPFFDADGEVSHYYAFINDITERKQAKARMEHLNRVLRAIRDVNQLITHEHNRDALLRRACEILISTRGYRSAWAALRGADGTAQTVAESGIGADFAPVRAALERGDWPACCRQAWEQPDGIAPIHDTDRNCASCSLTHTHRDATALAGALRYGGRDYGALVVALPQGLADDPEEQSLFRELVGDVAYALHAIDLAQARAEAEQKIQEQLDELRRWHAATLGREGRIMELKREVNELLAQAGQPPRYSSVAEDL